MTKLTEVRFADRPIDHGELESGAQREEHRQVLINAQLGT